MSDIKVSLSPSQQIVQQQSPQATVQDARGRTITLKKPGALAQYRLVEILGDSARNDTYLKMTGPLLWVAAIDGEVVHTPASKLQLEALIQKLDEDGIGAVSEGIVALLGEQQAAESDIKNAQGTPA